MNYLQQSIESVLTQTFSDFELIIINDGSTDDSELVVQKYLKKDERIRYFKQSNRGVASARNRGIQLAKGAYLCFLDADDYYHQDFLLTMLNTICDKNIAFCDYLLRKNNKSVKTKFTYRYNDLLEAYLYNRCVPNTNCWFIRKGFLMENEVRFPEKYQWGEDMLFFSKLLCLERDVAFDSRALTTYNVLVQNSLSSNTIDKMNHDIAWIEELKQYIAENIVEAKRKKALLYAIDSYRLPALIIYRLLKNKNIIDKNTYEKVKRDMHLYINSFAFSNGLRSLKLYLYKLQL